MRNCLLFFFLVMASSAAAQLGCNCPEQFALVKVRVEKNYPGYDIKTKGKTFKYRRLTDSLLMISRKASSLQDCHAILKSYLAFFRDKHMNISLHSYNEADSVDLLAFYASPIFKTRERYALKPGWQQSLTNDVEGIYYAEDSNYTVALLRNKTPKRDYIGVVLESKSRLWVPGQVQFELTQISQERFSGQFYTKRYEKIMDTAVYVNGTLQTAHTRWWNKNTLVRPFTSTTTKKPGSLFEFRVLDSVTNYLRLSDFDGRQTSRIDSFLGRYEPEIGAKPYLVIDIRGNPGGSTASFRRILPYIYTRPVLLAGNAFLSTPDNIVGLEQYAADMRYPADTRRFFQKLADSLLAHPNQYYIDGSKYDTLYVEKPILNPRKIAILVDHEVGSSAESLLLIAEQSDKVILVGENSSGTIDYVEQIYVNLPCDQFTLRYPIKRTLRLPDRELDNIGIKPNIHLSEKQDWIKEAQQFLKER